jgi:mono/diheme cytochrome c family protein
LRVYPACRVHLDDWFAHLKVLVILCTLLLIGACTKKQDTPEASAAAASDVTAAAPQADAKAGERAYKLNCAQCHNPNPAVVGAVGPEIAGSSRELIEARILNAAYPPGYQPKRQTKAMPAMPYLKKEIENLTAYLQSVK